MNNKIILAIFFIALLSIIPTFALENKTFDSMFTINYTWTGNISNSTLRIMGEALDTTETLSNESWFRTFWIHPTREIGNSSDITSVFTILATCLSQMNYTDQFIKCRDSNKNVTAELLDCREQAKFESNFTGCMGNLSEIANQLEDKDVERTAVEKSWQDKYDSLSSQKFWIMIVALIAGAYTLYDIIIVKKGHIAFKREEKTYLPRESRV